MLKSIRFAAASVVALCCVPFAPSPALATDDTVSVTIADVMASADAKEKLDGTVKFYFGDATHPTVVQSFKEYAVKEKAGFLQSNASGCNEAAVNVLRSFQAGAKALGGNAVINIRSFYKKNEIKIDTAIPCYPGGMRVGVTLKGEVVKLEN